VAGAFRVDGGEERVVSARLPAIDLGRFVLGFMLGGGGAILGMLITKIVRRWRRGKPS
jgi:hypothetical protein